MSHDLITLLVGFGLGFTIALILETVGLIEWVVTRFRNPKGDN